MSNDVDSVLSELSEVNRKLDEIATLTGRRSVIGQIARFCVVFVLGFVAALVSILLIGH